MAKDKSKEMPQTPEQSATNVRSYFTKEINDRINEMPLKQMENLMKDLANTEYWIALLKYTSMRTPILDATLRSTDPSKEPSKISWAQGAMAGLSDIETYIIDLNAQRPKEDEVDESAENRPEGIIS